MTDTRVWVCEEEPGQWTALCVDSRCAYNGIHAVLETEHKAAAEAAATRHRKYLRTLPREQEGAPARKDECPVCGLSPTVVRELQELVQELEARLAVQESAG